MKIMNLHSRIPIIRFVFSRGNQGQSLTDQTPGILDQTDTPHSLFSLLAILSLVLFVLFIAERL